MHAFLCALRVAPLQMFATSVQKLKNQNTFSVPVVIWFLGSITHTEGSTFTLPSVEGHYGLMKKEIQGTTQS